MSQIMITLNKIEAHEPCKDGWEKILSATHLHGGDYDKPFPLSAALETNGLDDTLWWLRCLPEHDRLWRKYAVWCARQVQHLMKDQPHIDVLDVADRYADGLASDEELAAARAEARGAAWGAARAEAWGAAWGASRGASRDAAWGASRAEAGRAALAAQSAKLKQLLDSGEWAEN